MQYRLITLPFALAATFVVIAAAMGAGSPAAKAEVRTAVSRPGCTSRSGQAMHQFRCATKRTTPTPAMIAALARGVRIDVGGYNLFITCTGTGRPTVVLEAGAWSDSRAWSTVMPGIARTTRVCSYDRAGMGHSDPRPSPPAGQATSRDAVRELHRLLVTVGLGGQLILAAHSFGGAIAMQYTYTYPADVVGLVLVDSVYPNACRDLASRGVDCGSETYLDFARSLNQLRALMPHHRLTGSLGARPLVVLYHGITGSVNAPLISPVEDLWPIRTRELARASSNSVLVRAVHSPHDIPRYAPQLILEAIHEVVGARRGSRHQLPACSQAFEQRDGACDTP